MFQWYLKTGGRLCNNSPLFHKGVCCTKNMDGRQTEKTGNKNVIDCRNERYPECSSFLSQQTNCCGICNNVMDGNHIPGSSINSLQSKTLKGTRLSLRGLFGSTCFMKTYLFYRKFWVKKTWLFNISSDS